MSGKGSSPRPFSVDDETYAANWDAIFRKAANDSPLNEADKESKGYGEPEPDTAEARPGPAHIHLWVADGDYNKCHCGAAEKAGKPSRPIGLQIFGDKAKSIPNKVGKDNGESESESAAEVTGPA